MKSTINNVVVLGIVYPETVIYLDDYFVSLQNQSNKEFDLWIFNDQLDTELLKTYTTKYCDLNINVKDVENNITPAQIRELAILNAKDKYSYLIFTDTDDFVSYDRIEKSINILQSYDFCYNNMILVDYKGQQINCNGYFRNKDNPIIVNDYIQLLDKNFCGLSNTAINLKNVNLDFLRIPPNIIAVDWWIFSLLLIKKYKGYYLEDTYTYYRQHETNIVGGLCRINEEQVNKGLYVKKEQYKLLLKYYPSEFDKKIINKLDNIMLLENKLKEPNYMGKFIEYVNNSNTKYMWWEYIKFDEKVD